MEKTVDLNNNAYGLIYKAPFLRNIIRDSLKKIENKKKD